MKTGFRWLLLLSFAVPSILIAAPLATPEEDRRAKQAIPAPGSALLYVYRSETGARVSPTLMVNGRELGALEPRTYFMLSVPPGRVDLRTAEHGSETLSLRVQEGRIYFVHFEVSTAGDGKLLQTSYGRGRQEVHAGRLVRAGQSAAVATRPAPVRRDEPGKAEPEAPSTGRAGFSLIVKGGTMSLARSSQSVLATNIELEATTAAIGIEAEWITAGGWAFGAEYLGHRHGYTSTAGDGDLAITGVMLNAKKYFRYGATAQPYFGIGLGSAAGTMSGSISGGAAGLAGQVMGGVAFRGEHFGLHTEIKYQSAKVEDDNGEGVEVGGLGLFVGVSVRF